MAGTATTSVQQVAEAYSAAWRAHDIDEILSWHAEDMVFRLHLPGYPEVTGADALRAHFAGLFAGWPDLEFRTVRLAVSADLFTHEMTMAGTLARPMHVGDRVVQPTGQRVEFEAVDVIPVVDGKVRRKDTYVDAAALLAQLDPVDRAGAASS